MILIGVSVPERHPEQEPKIISERPLYNAGDRVKLVGVSVKSKVTPNLTWFINNEPVDEQPCNTLHSTFVTSDNLTISTSELTFAAG